MTTLPESIRAKFATGANEILVRVSHYEQDCRTPAEYQAIVRYADRSRAWGVGVNADAETALRMALDGGQAEETTELNNYDPLEDL